MAKQISIVCSGDYVIVERLPDPPFQVNSIVASRVIATSPETFPPYPLGALVLSSSYSGTKIGSTERYFLNKKDIFGFYNETEVPDEQKESNGATTNNP